MASSIFHGSIDKFGRIVLPKELRDRFGIRPEVELEIEETESEILIRPVRKDAKLVRKGRFLVVTGTGPISQDIVNETMEKIRKERHESFL